MASSEEPIHLYRTLSPYYSLLANHRHSVCHLSTIMKFEVKKTPQGYVWDEDGKKNYIGPEDEDGLCCPNYGCVGPNEIVGTSVPVISNVYVKELASLRREALQMVQDIDKELNQLQQGKFKVVESP